MSNDDGPAAGRRWRDAAGEHIDVRGLPPPQPLLAILRLVHALGPAGAPIWVHHDRDPVLLYPELAEIGWHAERLSDAPEAAPASGDPMPLRSPADPADPSQPAPTPDDGCRIEPAEVRLRLAPLG